ncbi:MAG: Asp-tRNA(Asn)/Glu-tRNA(Gln) amidotransferase subunit GatB [Acidobacteria bacterium]|nr:Asp-tRNA(Asn)/Glu-tRNA(Gln) amidotransferase subunit GatB [Acidobacteriota bacterium]
MSSEWEPVIGLEVHCQLATKTKIFCSCPVETGSDPNTNVCPVCLGLPGALPVLSRDAVELAIQGALALNCEVQPASVFARKNYFYPDLPKGYQISQYDKPYALRGWLDIGGKRIGITRIHMEDDAGKSQHDGFRDSDRYTYVDLNRSGTPLIEIVSEPDVRSADEAVAYMTAVKQALEFAGVSLCDMEKGHLRCDANVSVRRKGEERFGTRTETKNVNSFRFLKQAIEYEIERQIGVLESGGRIVQETRLFDANSGETFSMRSKEDAHDYRYFPEPDLVPLRIGEKWLRAVSSAMPEMPQARRARFRSQYGLSEYDVDVLTATRDTADYFERAATAAGDAKAAANWVMGDLAAALKEAGKEIGACPVPAENLGALVRLIASGELSGKLAKEIFPKMFATGGAPAEIMEREGLKQISDAGAIEKIIDGIIAANPKQVEQFRGGKSTVLGFFTGQVMKATKGQANPGVVNALLAEKLK